MQKLATAAVVSIPADQMLNVGFIPNLKDFAFELMSLGGNQFMKLVARYSMDDANQMRSTDNPYFGQGIYKISTSMLTVNFDYDRKVEGRGGERGETRGSWHTVCMMGGKVTPISTHKGDVVTCVSPMAKPNPKTGKYSVNQLEAVLDDSGTIQFTTPDPRLYLRYEVVREAGDGSRQERTMKSSSEYFDADGEPFDVELIRPFFPDKSRKDETDFQLTPLAKVLELHAGGKIYRKMT